MKVTVKTLKSQQVPFDVEPDMKVSRSLHAQADAIVRKDCA